MNIEHLDATFPSILDTGILIDKRIKMTEEKIMTLLKIGLLTSKHIYIPANFITANANVINVFANEQMAPLFQSENRDGYCPLLVGFKKDRVGIKEDIQDGLAAGRYGLVNDQGLPIILPEDDKTEHGYYSSLGHNFDSKIEHVDSKFKDEVSEGLNIVIDVDRGDYKKRVEGKLDEIINKPKFFDKKIVELATNFSKKVEGMDSDQFSRSKCAHKLDQTITEINVDSETKTAFHQLCINAPWQQNLAHSDKTHYQIQGTPMFYYISQIFQSFENKVEDKITNQYRDEDALQVIKRKHVISALQHLSIEQILEIRKEKEFEKNITNLLDDSKDKDEVLDTHVSYLIEQIKPLGIVPDDSYLKEQKLYSRTSKISKVFEFIENTTSSWQTTLLGNLTSNSSWAYLPNEIVEGAKLGLTTYFFTRDVLHRLNQRQMWNDWESAITFAFKAN